MKQIVNAILGAGYTVATAILLVGMKEEAGNPAYYPIVVVSFMVLAVACSLSALWSRKK